MIHTESAVTEEFLHFVWEQRLFRSEGLKTISGDHLEILEPGTLNGDSGPDFFNARVRINGTLWAGNIEIHRMSSDWYRHRHQDDPCYDNIILHVVHRCDQQVLRSDGQEIPTLVLPVPAHVLDGFSELMRSRLRIPCQDKIRDTDVFMLKIGFNRLMVERLQEKTGEINNMLEQNRHDWKEAFYQVLARSFGLKVNAVPFELLAKAMPEPILGKHRDNLRQTEALLFGQSGLLHLELLGDDYFLNLRSEYEFLSKKYHLQPLSGHLWKFMRTRPVNFPTIRIAQFAALIHKNGSLFSLLDDQMTLAGLKERFQVCASPYWNNHYRFSQVSGNSCKHLGEKAVESLIINCLAPFLFVYGEQTGKQALKDKALEWLDQIAPEENAVVREWEETGVKATSAFETQALLQLRNRYCEQKRCLHCHIGTRLIKNG